MERETENEKEKESEHEKEKETETKKEQENENEKEKEGEDEGGYVQLLKRVQVQIEEKELGEEGEAMVEAVWKILQEWKQKGIIPAGKGAIFRSSTNVEDLPG